MNDPPLEFFALVDSIPGPDQEARQRLAARLETLIEAEREVLHSSRRRKPGTWAHRATVVSVAAVILAVFFVPLPHVSLFKRLVTPAAKPATATTVPLTRPSTIPTTNTTRPASPPPDVYVRFITPKVGWASEGIPGRLFITTDGGIHWRDISPPVLMRKDFGLGSDLTSGSFLSSSDFFVSVYHSYKDVLYHTTDGGRKWLQAGSFPNSAEAWVSFVNDQRGWVAVDNGSAGGAGSVTIYETMNSGSLWSIVSRSGSVTGAPGTTGNPGTCRESGLSVSGTSVSPVLWLSGASNLAPCLVCSLDGGKLWTGCNGPSDPSKGSGGEAWPPVFSSTSSGALVATYGTPHKSVTAFFTTTNGGDIWSERPPPPAQPGLMDVVSSTTWFATANRTLYTTTDSGNNWTSVPTLLVFGGGEPGTLDFVNTLDGWVVLKSEIWRTTDGGRQWEPELLTRSNP